MGEARAASVAAMPTERLSLVIVGAHYFGGDKNDPLYRQVKDVKWSQALLVEAPSGRELSVEVPEGLGPGDQLEVWVSCKTNSGRWIPNAVAMLGHELGQACRLLGFGDDQCAGAPWGSATSSGAVDPGSWLLHDLRLGGRD